MLTRIFCYGTLKREGAANNLMRNAKFVAEASTHSRYQLYDMGGFPGMIEGEEGGNGVKGEVFDCDESTMKQLDVYEGVAWGLFVRKKVELNNGELVEAYFFNRSDRSNKSARKERLIVEGVWR